MSNHAKLSSIMEGYYRPERENLFESLPAMLPVKARSSEWKVEEDRKLCRTFEFKNSEDLKGFVSSVIDESLRSEIQQKIVIDGMKVSIKLDFKSVVSQNSKVKDFTNSIDSLKDYKHSERFPRGE